MSQPDLNWTNPEVRKAVWEVMEFWLNRKTDGFRVRLNSVSLICHCVADFLYDLDGCH